MIVFVKLYRKTSKIVFEKSKLIFTIFVETFFHSLVFRLRASSARITFLLKKSVNCFHIFMLNIGNYTRIVRKKVASFLLLLVGLCPADALLKSRCLEALQSSMSSLLHLFCWSIGLIFLVPYFYREIFICSFKLSLCCLCFVDDWKIFLQFVIWSFNQVSAFCNKYFADQFVDSNYLLLILKQAAWIFCGASLIIFPSTFGRFVQLEFRKLQKLVFQTILGDQDPMPNLNTVEQNCYMTFTFSIFLFPRENFCKFCFDQNQTNIFRQWAISQWASRMCTQNWSQSFPLSNRKNFEQVVPYLSI